ncbi:hypothetical protein BDR07DRAFT_1413265 [Suillus spraguei]|nr:hypothetical protein BDR07DRAFT_1413265 [Suillus spraguei]
MPQRTHRQVSASTKSNYVCVAGKEKTSSNPPASPTEARKSYSTGVQQSSTSELESDTNEASDDSSVYSDPPSLSTVSRLDSSTDSDTESESAGSIPDSGTKALFYKFLCLLDVFVFG